MIESNVIKRIQMIIFYLISFCIIIDGGSMYTQLHNAIIKQYQIKILLMSLCVLYILINKKVSKVSIIAALCTALVILIYIVFSYQRPYFSSSLVFLVEFSLLIMFFFEVSINNDLSILLDAFSRVVTIFSLISLVFWLMGSILHIIPGKEAIYYWGSEYPKKSINYFNVYYENPVQATDNGIIRNTGLFTEAPGHAVRIVYALCIELFYKTNRNKLRISILALTMISTLSSKGIIILAYIICAFVLISQKKTNKALYYLQFILVIIIVVISSIVSISIFNNEMSSKSSDIVRYDHMVSGFKTWLQYPLFGAGYNNSAALALNHIYSITPDGASMGIATTLGMGGIYIFLFYIASFFVAFKQLNKHFSNIKMRMFAFGGAVLIDWFISNIGFTTIMISIVCIGYSTLNLKNKTTLCIN